MKDEEEKKEKKQKKRKKLLNKSNFSILVTTYIFLAVFLGLIGYLVYFNIVEADGIINNSYNKRQEILAEKITRGNIISSDGKVLATTVKDENGNESRYYPYSNLFAHTVGYINNGGYGIESNSAYYMLTSNQFIFDQIENDISGRKNQGDNVVTTLDTFLQQTSYDALGSNKGAVIIMEPGTGRILAMVSKPDFNPNTLSSDWNDIVNGTNNESVLVNRSTQGLYPPGSTFKIVTLLEYIKENPETYKDYSYNCTGMYAVDNNNISCAHQTAHGEEDALLSFANSCNCSFINMGTTLDIDRYKKTANGLLFNSELPLDMEYNKSKFTLSDKDSDFDKAQTYFGQGRTLITPIHLALIGCAIANNGELMKPMLLDHVESCNNTVIKNFKQETYGNLMSKEDAMILRNGMEEVIKKSFDWLYTDKSYTVAGKSGTAQYGTEGFEHSLFISYSPVDNPEIVVAVVVEGGTQKNITAAEVAKKIYDAYYHR